MTRGSEWRRWDPHLHAPGTLLNDQFRGDWEAYFQKIDQATPAVTALGVTDYFSIRTYREVRRRQIEEGRLPNVAFIFPNVEMRLDIKTDRARPINLHLLFSPDDPNHEVEIERALGRLSCEFGNRPWYCVERDLAEIGRMRDPNQRDHVAALRAGAQQFKVTLADLRALVRGDEWVRKNCLVAVAGGRGDGTSGLQEDDSYAMMRQEIETFADIIFASTPSVRDFWLGKRTGFGPDVIEARYKTLKPCLHGSDAHREEEVAAPVQDRCTWLKGDPTFETLRQAVIEPDERVWIGPQPPLLGTSAPTIRSIRVAGAPWLVDHVDLNPGLVAIIGERGSGKTALLEILARGAHACGSSERSSASFLKRATDPVDLIGDATVELDWSDDSVTRAAVRPVDDEDEVASWDRQPEAVKYLSQQFVEQLCSAAGLATKLREEIERVIFEATPRVDRHNAASFDALAQVWLEPAQRRRSELRDAILAAGDTIEREDQLKQRLPAMRKDRADLAAKLLTSRLDLGKLLPTGKEERAKRLLELETACSVVETAVQTARSRLQRVEDLGTEVVHLLTTVEPARFARMKTTFTGAGLADDDWSAFAMGFVGNVDDVIKRARDAAAHAIAIATEGDREHPVDLSTAPITEWPLVALEKERDKAKKEVGIDAQLQKKYDDLNRTIGKLETGIRKLDEGIAEAEGAENRRTEAMRGRQHAYAQVFETFVDEEGVLARLYAPLAGNLSASAGAVAKLAVNVERHVDVAAWVKAGERLLDLRSATRFRGHGALAAEAERALVPAWRTGSADVVAAAMDRFREDVREDLTRAMPPSIENRSDWLRSVARWLYSTDHVSIEYGITYEGVRVEQLSPGTRGIVLLLLFLAVDQQDRRPLLVDQPEENLDPKSVFFELVPHFRAARRRRQVIIVTHNANLVVNTDADQVLVATASHAAPGQLPTISYAVGSLENREIRVAVCATLEGGERAFLERERRYRLRWGESDALATVAAPPTPATSPGSGS